MMIKKKPVRAALCAILCCGPLGLEFLGAQEESPPLFIRGDCNANGETGEWITEALTIFGNRFLGTRTIPCLDACDANDDGSVDLSDGVYLLNHGFLGGPAPSAPYPGCGVDPRALGRESDLLDCEEPPPTCQPNKFCPELRPDDLVEKPFRRGDINGQGSIDLSTSINLLNWLFSGGGEPGCLDAADMNDDGCIDMRDVLQLPPFCTMWLGFGFCPEVGPCGEDASADFLGCEVSACES